MHVGRISRSTRFAPARSAANPCRGESRRQKLRSTTRRRRRCHTTQYVLLRQPCSYRLSVCRRLAVLRARWRLPAQLSTIANTRALAQLRIAADRGNSRAPCITGLTLRHGEKLYGAEIRTDRVAAVRDIEKAAPWGDATATFMLRCVAQRRAPRSVALAAEVMKRE